MHTTLRFWFQTLLFGTSSKDWVSVCEVLNNVRRLSIFDKEVMLGVLGDVISFIVKSLKNPRSAVCKTAIMTCPDIFKAYTDDIIDLLDPLAFCFPSNSACGFIQSILLHVFVPI
ncbi:unnamed protein product [Fraxinus pennsylvanica]|uniref:Uncharacterized protein n=1 Tax=Fraxinus pennsylvanica TaxID=56036 RepID=A0AAD1ZX90_9LAMI|nr:unnamed protein product [Fraxinus pennsylvanica]